MIRVDGRIGQRGGGRKRFLMWQGEKYQPVELAKIAGITPKTMVSRINRNGVEQAMAMVLQIKGSRDEVLARRAAIYDIAEEQQPSIVRSIYYQAVVRGTIRDKTTNGYKMVQNDTVLMRKGKVLIDGKRMPYKWIIDNTRDIIEPYAFASVADALEQTANNYRVDLWKDADCLVQVWVEKDGLAGVIQPVTLECGVPLCPARGYSSLSFLYEVAQRLRRETRPVFAYLLGDYDPSGVNAHESIEETMREMAEEVGYNHKRLLKVKRLALTPAQIKKWKLPTRPTKQSDTRSAGWEGGDRSVELDAVEPKRLRKLVKDAIDKHMDDDERTRLRKNEAREREYIRDLSRA
jgi:hypothetical protein